MTCIFKGMFLLAALVALLSFASTDSVAKSGPSHGKVVVCYIGTWAAYRPGQGVYNIEDFDANLCTHAIYSFAGLDAQNNAIKSLDPWQDLYDNWGKGGYERLTGMKRNYPHLKVLLAIGGWNEGSEKYSQLCADPWRRSQFVKQASSFIRQYGFDGLDLDWEYPTQRGGQWYDRQNFVQWTKELREEFDRHNLLLTAAFGAGKSTVDQAYDIPQLSKYLHFMHIMTYDFHASWDNQIGYNAPLYAPSGDPFSTQYAIDYLIQLGAPPSKIVLGVPFYGRSFRTRHEGNHGDASEGAGQQGPYTGEGGYLGYNEICGFLQQGWTASYDSWAAQMLAKSPRDGSGYRSVVTYDDTRAIEAKVKWAQQKGLGGIMIWSVDTDDYRGACGKRYALLHAVNDALNRRSLDEIETEDVVVPEDVDNQL